MLSFLLNFSFEIADDKGFVCQECGLIRSKEEVKKIAAEIRETSDKASKSLSSGSILCCCFCLRKINLFGRLITQVYFFLFCPLIMFL